MDFFPSIDDDLSVLDPQFFSLSHVTQSSFESLPLEDLSVCTNLRTSPITTLLLQHGAATSSRSNTPALPVAAVPSQQIIIYEEEYIEPTELNQSLQATEKQTYFKALIKTLLFSREIIEYPIEYTLELFDVVLDASTSKLFKAAYIGDISLLDGFNCQELTDYLIIATQLAAAYGHVALFERLYQANFYNALERSKSTYLHASFICAAARSRHERMVHYLINQVSPNVPFLKHFCTLLFLYTDQPLIQKKRSLERLIVPGKKSVSFKFDSITFYALMAEERYRNEFKARASYFIEKLIKALARSDLQASIKKALIMILCYNTRIPENVFEKATALFKNYFNDSLAADIMAYKSIQEFTNTSGIAINTDHLFLAAAWGNKEALEILLSLMRPSADLHINEKNKTDLIATCAFAFYNNQMALVKLIGRHIFAHNLMGTEEEKSVIASLMYWCSLN